MVLLRGIPHPIKIPLLRCLEGQGCSSAWGYTCELSYACLEEFSVGKEQAFVHVIVFSFVSDEDHAELPYA